MTGDVTWWECADRVLYPDWRDHLRAQLRHDSSLFAPNPENWPDELLILEPDGVWWRLRWVGKTRDSGVQIATSSNRAFEFLVKLLADAPSAHVWERSDPPEWLDVIATTRLEVPSDALVRLRLRPADNELTLEAIEVHSSSGRLGARSPRRLSLGAVLKRLAHFFETEEVPIFGSPWHRHVKHPGVNGRPDRFYAGWARRYVDSLEAGDSKPVQKLIREERAAGHHATEGQIRAYLNQARVRELLTAAPSGRAGGRLTTKALEALRQISAENFQDPMSPKDEPQP